MAISTWAAARRIPVYRATKLWVAGQAPPAVGRIPTDTQNVSIGRWAEANGVDYRQAWTLHRAGRLPTCVVKGTWGGRGPREKRKQRNQRGHLVRQVLRGIQKEDRQVARLKADFRAERIRVKRQHNVFLRSLLRLKKRRKQNQEWVNKLKEAWSAGLNPVTEQDFERLMEAARKREAIAARVSREEQAAKLGATVQPETV